MHFHELLRDLDLRALDIDQILVFKRAALLRTRHARRLVRLWQQLTALNECERLLVLRA